VQVTVKVEARVIKMESIPRMRAIFRGEDGSWLNGSSSFAINPFFLIDLKKSARKIYQMYLSRFYLL
jgi:hypothetical protein